MKIKYKGGILRSREKREFRPREGMEASIQRGSWSFRLGQEMGMNNLRSREGEFPSILGKMPSSIQEDYGELRSREGVSFDLGCYTCKSMLAK